MTNIVVVFPKAEEAKGIKSLLMRNGFHVTAVCTTGTQAISQIDDLDSGIIVCGYKFVDMMYFGIHDCMPEGFEMLLIASENHLMESRSRNIISLSMPLKVHDLINTVTMMVANSERRKRSLRARPKERRPEEVAMIQEAKDLLMNRNHMSEEEAHRYLQKCSMDSSTNMVEAAQMVLTMMKG